jgi:hypothetical protein
VLTGAASLFLKFAIFTSGNYDGLNRFG